MTGERTVAGHRVTGLALEEYAVAGNGLRAREPFRRDWHTACGRIVREAVGDSVDAELFRAEGGPTEPEHPCYACAIPAPQNWTD